MVPIIKVKILIRSQWPRVETLANQIWPAIRTLETPGRDVHPPKPMMHITYSPSFLKTYKFAPILARFTFL